MTYIFSNEDSDLATLKWHRHSGGYAYRWFGDMNISRHKETPYRNDYPCGSRCEDCGTFWID